MKRKALEKNFDQTEVQAINLDLSRLWSKEAYEQYGEPADVHPEIATRLDAAEPGTVLDMGCGTGTLKQTLRAKWIGVDRSVLQLRQARGPTAIADLRTLPFADETFGAVATLYTLYFFEDPSLVATEARRVLKPGGLFAVCAPSLKDSPEIAHIARNPDEGAFSSEDIEELLNEQFIDVEINEWNFPFLELKDLESARDYIHFFYYPHLSVSESAGHARALDLPVKITKIGAWGVGRKPSSEVR